LSSLAGDPGLTQFVPLVALRSGWVRSMPVSITATLTELASRAVPPDTACIRATPVGTVSPAASAVAVACTSRSGVTEATSGSRWRRATCPGLSSAAKPLTARW
jgi:hypothetical protein